MYDKLNNINNLRRYNKQGIYKKWIYKNLIDYDLNLPKNIGHIFIEFYRK